MPEYNKKNSPVIKECGSPIWLNGGYLQDALRKYFKDNSLKVTSVRFTPAIGKGENYASVMTRAHVNFIRKSVLRPCSTTFIVKTSFEGDEFSMEKILQYDVYNREIDIYKNILPKLTALLREAGDLDNLFPEAIHTDNDKIAMIFEDLSNKSFVCADRKGGLDEAHLKLALVKLAKMHAASAVLNEREPKLFKGYDQGMFNRHTEAFKNLYLQNIETCSELISKWGDDFREYSEKLLKLKPWIMEYGKRVFDVKPDQFNSFVHGDFWITNVMYIYNDTAEMKKQPIDACIIDFQYSFWGHPTIDLHYLFNTSIREELRLNNQEEFLQFYHKILTETLKKLKYAGKVPTLQDFFIQFIEKSFYAFISAILIQPLHINENTDDADFRALMADDERAKNFKRTIYSNEKVHKNLKRLLPFFDRRGLLDVVD